MSCEGRSTHVIWQICHMPYMSHGRYVTSPICHMSRYVTWSDMSHEQICHIDRYVACGQIMSHARYVTWPDMSHARSVTWPDMSHGHLCYMGRYVTSADMSHGKICHMEDMLLFACCTYLLIRDLMKSNTISPFSFNLYCTASNNPPSIKPPRIESPFLLIKI